MLPRENLKVWSPKTAGNAPKTRILLKRSLSMGIPPYSGRTNLITRGVCG